MKNLVLAGGVALNCVANGRLLREGPFEAVWIQPAAGDAGGALGAALFVWHQLLRKPRRPDGRADASGCYGADTNPKRQRGDRQEGSFLGPRFSSKEVRQFLNGVEAPYQHFADEGELFEHTAGL